MRAQTSYMFFKVRAGYSYDPQKETKEQGKQRCARALVRAEKWAQEQEYEFIWEVDPDTDSSAFDDSPNPWLLWVCDMYDSAGRFVSSLGGNDFGRDGEPWGDPYKRVVEAELALEIMPE